MVAYVDILRPGLADAGGDMRKRVLGVGVNLCRGELQLAYMASVPSGFCCGDAINVAL